MNRYYHGVLMVLLSALGYALMPTFAKFAYQSDVTITTLLTIRFSLATLVFFCFFIIKKENIKVNKRNLLGLFFLGAVCYTLQSTFYFSSVKYIPASLVVLIVFTHPTFVAITSCILDREPFTKYLALSLISSFMGLVLMLGTTLGEINLLGIMFAGATSLVYTLYIILSNRILKKVPTLIATSYITLFSALGFLFSSLFSHDLDFSFQSAAWPWILALTAFSTVMGMFTFFRGLQILGPTKATILSMAEPVFGVMIAMILFQERLTPLQFLGAAGVIAGAIIAVYTQDKHEIRPANSSV